MKHPIKKIQKNQDDFLKNCPDNMKEFHARMFRIGNASYRYHKQANSLSVKMAKKYFHEWLEGLPDSITADMRAKGFEACKTMLPFTRYVNERCDAGMDDWMKEHLSEEDFKVWLNQGKETKD
ncbi:hypothetical protein SAMN06265379_11411 [Saccharicrinis carchari]|uniref:Uncharacterized protein n=1 Tax=Saccharicrinis carchari TaxID=1168039 RepID=A0A521F3M7_SACCC|nr:hypothetical protein [Saccharicrinis carchari]SMO90773.1 hypothetical protein SAMN06265379_11411 [Saccharicrinis carchari]